MKELDSLLGRRGVFPIPLGRAGDGGEFEIYAEDLDGRLTIITGKKESGKSHLSKMLVKTLVQHGAFVVVFDLNNEYSGLGWNRDAEGWTAQVNGWWSHSDGEAEVFSPPGGTPDVGRGFDNYEDYEVVSIEGIVDFELTKHLSIGGRLLYEDFTIDSFIRQNLANYLPGALLIVANDGDYQAWSAGLRMSARF